MGAHCAVRLHARPPALRFYWFGCRATEKYVRGRTVRKPSNRLRSRHSPAGGGAVGLKHCKDTQIEIHTSKPQSLQRVPLHCQFISERGLFTMRILNLATLAISMVSGNYIVDFPPICFA